MRYSLADVEAIENEMICSLRDQLFAEWRIFTLEGDDVHRPEETERFRRYMLDHAIPHYEEWHDGFVWFLIPEQYDSYDWEIPDG
ncbi:MAG: hypothetical protein JO112_09285 [Planctomycetes bacterium]|nr:hypothetical protein [Planctomycetota bacterium]